jgi:hypothetical protein
MKRILYITDSIKPDTSTLDFACYLCNLSHSALTGIFLENLVNEVRSVKALKEMAMKVSVDTERFKNICEQQGVIGIVDQDSDLLLDDIVVESRYTDLVLIDASTSLAAMNEGTPTRFVRDVLADAECPVVVLPESFEGLNKLVFTYDGRSSSVFAIKQFTYLFPELHAYPVLVITVMNGKNGPGPEEHYRLKEWLQEHYTDIDLIVAEGSVKSGLLDSLLLHTRDFIVMGAYGRNAFSTLFSPSYAELVLRLVSQPVFIAHQ